MLPYHYLLQIIVMFVKFVYITLYFMYLFSLRAERCSRGRATRVAVIVTF